MFGMQVILKNHRGETCKFLVRLPRPDFVGARNDEGDTLTSFLSLKGEEIRGVLDKLEQ